MDKKIDFNLPADNNLSPYNENENELHLKRIAITSFAPIVILFGPVACGKTMALIRLIRYLEANDYTVKPDRLFRPNDCSYQELCNSFNSQIYSDIVRKGNDLMIQVNDKYDRIVCQILEMSGHFFFNQYNLNENTDLPYYLKEIIFSVNKKIWVFFVEEGWKNYQDRREYVQTIAKMNNLMSQKDKVILLCNKVDKKKIYFANGNPIKKYFWLDIQNQYPQIGTKYKNKNLITRFCKPYNFDFIVFSAGIFPQTNDGREAYVPSRSEYPACLWKSIIKSIR